MNKAPIKTFLLFVFCIFLSACSVRPTILPPATQVVVTPTVEITPTLRIETPVPATPSLVPTPTVTATADPAQRIYTLTFAGDCTLGAQHGKHGYSNSFLSVVQDRYDHPFKNVQTYFANDDFTFVNLEGVFTTYNQPVEKAFNFRADPKYVACLTQGSVEGVSLANNHSKDYGEIGYQDTKKTLEEAQVVYACYEEPAIYDVDERLRIGVIGLAFYPSESVMQKQIQKCKDQNCNMIIASFHWGAEGHYRKEGTQQSFARRLIDWGCDAVVGHHPHVLQETEIYKDKPIFYSLGNFSFGGNNNPKDKDTALVQMKVRVLADKSIHKEEVLLIPCRLSSTPSGNDFCPTPYIEGSQEYNRAMSKLSGTFKGNDLVSDTPRPSASPDKKPTQKPDTTEKQTQAPTQKPDPTPEPVPTPDPTPEPQEE